jgi:hypothetical protein
MRAPIEIGDVVRLRKHFTRATVTATLDHAGVPGGLVLDKALGGFRYWNSADVSIVRRGPVRLEKERRQNRERQQRWRDRKQA